MEVRSDLHQRPGLDLGESRPQPQRLQIVGCFGEHGLPKASQQPGQYEEISLRKSCKSPPGDGACCDRLTGASQSLRPDSGVPFYVPLL